MKKIIFALTVLFSLTAFDEPKKRCNVYAVKTATLQTKNHTHIYLDSVTNISVDSIQFATKRLFDVKDREFLIVKYLDGNR